MDQGVHLAFNSVGLDDVTFGLPTFADGWKGLIITGSSQRALQNANDGGRLLLNIKCVNDPAGVDNGKEHLIGLNVWHNDPAVKARADAELATIIRCIFGGDRQINSTAELYNQPFFAKAVTQTAAPSPKYPNPQPQTNWRGYADRLGNENGKQGGINVLSAAGGQSQGGGFGNNSQPPATFGQPPATFGQPQGGGGFGQPPQQFGQPQGGNGGNGTFGQPAPQQQNNGGFPNAGGQPGFNQGGNQNGNPTNDQNGGGWGNNGAPQGGNAQQPNTAQPNGGWGGSGGGNAPFPSNGQQPGGQGGQGQQGGWTPQGGNGQQPPQQGGWGGQGQQPGGGNGWG